MKVDAGIGFDLGAVGRQARELEEMGFSGIQVAETAHDPFLPLAQAALHTERIDLMTGIAVAFARTPMVLAYAANDLNIASRGRFTLGLGSQIRAHITKRFSMPWSDPAARMREYILALRAIWAHWHRGEPLEFHGAYYRHTLMTPFFTPEIKEYGAPQIALAAVGPLMTEVAGEVADGVIVHPFMTETYLRDTMMPALERGWTQGGKSRDEFEISYPCFVVTGRDEQEMELAKTAAKHQLAFYGSTPAYRVVLESIGVGDLQPKLNLMSKKGQWSEMGELFSDDLLHQFGIVAEPDQVGRQLKARYGDIVDRISIAYSNRSVELGVQLIEQLKLA